MPRTIIEPFRIRMVEPLPRTTRGQREDFLRDAYFNPFLLHAGQITIDLLTDSGTGAMSANQWAAMMTGDETYAGSESFYRLRYVVQNLTGAVHVIPTHQGRAAEHILFSALDLKDRVVLANSHFDTTRANVEALGGIARDLVVAEALDPRCEAPFKGNIDLERLEAGLVEYGRDVGLVLITVTNNSLGGQPVSLGNIRAAAALARRFGVPFFLDAARFSENAWFIREREEGQRHRSPREIAREMFQLADGFTLSAKKDGLVNIGGLLGVNDDALAERARNRLVLIEGFPTYGGLAGRDLAAMAVGLEEVLDESYLEYRVASVRYLHRLLCGAGVPLMHPAGGHAVYIDAAALYPHIPAEQFPGLSFVNELYIEGGVRAVEVGSLMFGAPPDGMHKAREVPLELVRLAVPRRTYTQSHIDLVGELVADVFAKRNAARGYRIVWQPDVLRAFTTKLAPVESASPVPAVMAMNDQTSSWGNDPAAPCCGCGGNAAWH